MRTLLFYVFLIPFFCSCLSGPDLQSRYDDENRSDTGGNGYDVGEPNDGGGGEVTPDGGGGDVDLDGGIPLTDGGFPDTGTHPPEGPLLQCTILYPESSTGQRPIGERVQVGCTHDASAPQVATFSYQATPVMGDFTPTGYGEFIWQVTNVPTTFTDTQVTLTVTATWASPTPMTSSADLSIDLLGNLWIAVTGRGVLAMGSDGSNQGFAIGGLHLDKPLAMVQSADGHKLYVAQREEPWISAFAFSNGSHEFNFDNHDGTGAIWANTLHPLGLMVLAERNQIWVTGLRGKIAIFNLAGAFLRYRDLGNTQKLVSIAPFGNDKVIVSRDTETVIYLVPLDAGEVTSHRLEFCNRTIWGPIDSILATANGYYVGVRHGSDSYPFHFADDLRCLAGAQDGYYNVNMRGLAVLGNSLVTSFQMSSRCLAQYDATTVEQKTDLCPMQNFANMYGLLKIKEPQ